MGSEVEVISSISAVSAVAGVAETMGEGGETRDHLLEREDRFFDALAAGRHGHD